jgi:hypothetical protein
MTTRRTARRTRKQQQDIMGICLIALVLGLFIGSLYGAYKIDEARGITVCQSLASAGIGNKGNCL